MKKEGIIRRFNRWVRQNYKGRYMEDPPKNWDRRKELYWKIGPMQYGPIKAKDIPKEFL